MSRFIVHHPDGPVGCDVEPVDEAAQQQLGVEQRLDVQLALRGLEAAWVLKREVAVEHLTRGAHPLQEAGLVGGLGVVEHVGERRVVGDERLPRRHQHVAGRLGRPVGRRQGEQVLQDLVHERPAHRVDRERLRQAVDRAEPEQQRTGHEVHRPAGRDRAEDVDPVDPPGDALGRRGLLVDGHTATLGERTDNAALLHGPRSVCRVGIASTCVRAAFRAVPDARTPGASTAPAGHVQGRDHRRQRSTGDLLVVHHRRPDRLGGRASGRPGRARSGRLQVRRRLRVRGRAVPVGAAARGLARVHGAALRLPGQLDHPALPRRCHGHRGRGAHPAPGALHRRGETTRPRSPLGSGRSGSGS